MALGVLYRNCHAEIKDQMGRHPSGVALFFAHSDVFFHIPHYQWRWGYYTETATLKSSTQQMRRAGINPILRQVTLFRLLRAVDQMGRHPFSVALFFAHFDVFFHIPHYQRRWGYYTETATLQSSTQQMRRASINPILRQVTLFRLLRAVYNRNRS